MVEMFDTVMTSESQNPAIILSLLSILLCILKSQLWCESQKRL